MKKWGLLKIVKAQSRITLQDLGRVGWQHLGVCQSGAADEHAFLWANKLLGNPCNTVALEILFGQAIFEFTADTVIAITGAQTPVFINQQPAALWQTHRIKSGDIVEFKHPLAGLLNYLVIKKGFKIKPLVCNSLSQCEREGLGPFNGKPLTAGCYLGFELGPRMTDHLAINKALNPKYIPNYNAPLVLPIYPNTHRQYANAVNVFVNTDYTVSPVSNRMGYRLIPESFPKLIPRVLSKTAPQKKYKEPHPLEYYAKKLGAKTVSAGVALGCVQLPPNGEPIILLKDRQTMGGYPVLGCISQTSTFRLAQCRPGQAVKFQIANPEDRLKNARQLQNIKIFFAKGS